MLSPPFADHIRGNYQLQGRGMVTIYYPSYHKTALQNNTPRFFAFLGADR